MVLVSTALTVVDVRLVLLLLCWPIGATQDLVRGMLGDMYMQMHVQIVQQGMNSTVAAIYICCRSWRLYQLLRHQRWGGVLCCPLRWYEGNKQHTARQLRWLECLVSF